MNITTANEFRKQLKSEVDRCAQNHEILKVQRRNGEDFIVMSESDWKSIEETIFLNQVPGLVESIHHSDKEPLEKGTPLEDLDW